MTREVSDLDEECGGCGDPFRVCTTSIKPWTPPAGSSKKARSGYRLLRCCGACTHYGHADKQWDAIQERLTRRS